MNIKLFLSELYFRPQRIAANLFDVPAIILIYHRVAELENDPQMLAVKPDNFFRQIEYLRSNYNILTADEFSENLSAGKIFPKGTILITFDDGYADNANIALPILESLNKEALFFITTSNLNTSEEMWWDKLDQLFHSGVNLPGMLNITVNNNQHIFSISDEKSKLQAYYSLHRLIKFNRKEARDKILKELFELAGAEEKSRLNYRMVNNEELIKMDRSPAAKIGAHTHTHTPLSILTYDEQYEEINKSKKILEELLNHKVQYFSYPFGNFKDFNYDSIRASDSLKFNMVCANFYGQVHSWTNRYKLPRALVRDWDFEYFKQQIKRFFRY